MIHSAGCSPSTGLRPERGGADAVQTATSSWIPPRLLMITESLLWLNQTHKFFSTVNLCLPACLLAFAAADMSLRVMARVEVAVYCLPLFWQARPTFFFSDPNVICFRIVARRKILSRWALSGIFFLSSLRHQVALWKSEVDRGAHTQVVFPKLNKTRCKPRIFIV